MLEGHLFGLKTWGAVQKCWWSLWHPLISAHTWWWKIAKTSENCFLQPGSRDDEEAGIPFHIEQLTLHGQVWCSPCRRRLGGVLRVHWWLTCFPKLSVNWMTLWELLNSLSLIHKSLKWFFFGWKRLNFRWAKSPPSFYRWRDFLSKNELLRG